VNNNRSFENNPKNIVADANPLMAGNNRQARGCHQLRLMIARRSC
jgi:hypothetical protein